MKKMFLFFQIIAFELVAVNSPYYYENTLTWQSTCSQAVLKSQIRWVKLAQNDEKVGQT